MDFTENLFNNNLLECNKLTKIFGGTTALNDLSLTFERGRIIGLLGPNGSGKTTFIKLINGLLVPTRGSITINGYLPGVETKKVISYLPDKMILNNWMKVNDLVSFYKDFYEDFKEERAYDMLKDLDIAPNARLKSLSKGTKEKVQLIMVMSRDAELYCLDEPIGGVDPAARDYILNTIIQNYNHKSSILLSTHLIADVENILDDAIFLKYGTVTRYAPVDQIREESGMSLDELFREEFKC
ncbi:MAG: ABC transporter ATP-binding protein [Lachnospiraceae bacterium]|nr:ABC transporter ATP-binding protein [Lachnospiraceae bacterium]